MKFKNYVNSYTKDNRIYSKEDISNMSVRDAYGKKRAILAQNRRIGVPSDAELRNSSNVIWVNPYRREDGTEVKGYWRSKSGSAMGSTGGIIGDNNIPPMDEQSDDIEDIIYGKKKRTGDIQDIDMDGGDEEITPVSATVDLIVALSQIFLKDTEIGEIIEAFAPVIKAIGEKVFGDDDLDFEIDDQYSEQAEESIDSPENVQTDSSINPIEQISEPNGLEGTLTGGASEISAIKEDGIEIKADTKITKFKNSLIQFNNKQNANYKDARDLMNMSIIGPDNLENTKNFKVLSIDEAKTKLSNLGIKDDSNTRTIEFSEGSTIYEAVNNSRELRTQINNNIEKIKNGESIQIEFKDDSNLFRSLHNAALIDCKVQGNVISGYLYDKYDFEYQMLKQKENLKIINISKLDVANDSATFLQNKGVLQNYHILVPITIKL